MEFLSFNARLGMRYEQYRFLVRFGLPSVQKLEDWPLSTSGFGSKGHLLTGEPSIGLSGRTA